MICTTIKEGVECPFMSAKGVLTTRGFAIRSSKSARVATAVANIRPVGIVRPVPNPQ